MVVVRFSAFVLELICFWRVRMQCQHGKHERLHVVVKMRLKGLKCLQRAFYGCGF